MAQPASPVPDRVLSPSRTQAAEARRAARREQLRDFYGLKREGESSASSAPSTPGGRARRGSKEGALDFTSPNFVPAEYYEHLLARASLPELLKTTSDLATDVGRLHSSRHTLVYNHHHQLFSAGDTIAALNTRTPQLLSIVTDLQERFSEMSQLADSVALPDPPGGTDEAARATAAAQQGLERVRLMVLAEEPAEKVRSTWERVEASLSQLNVPNMEKVREEGRELVSIRTAMEEEAKQ